MRGAAHDPAFARRMGIPQSVAREFVTADQRAGLHSVRARDVTEGRRKRDGKGSGHKM